MKKVNICGIQESEFDKDGWCRRCRNECKMIHNVMVDEDIYSYAKRNGIIEGNDVGSVRAMFSKSEFIHYFINKPSRYKRAPKYVKRYLSDLGVYEDDITPTNQGRDNQAVE